MPAKRAVKKTAPAKKVVSPRKSASKPKPKLHAKNVTIVVSVGEKGRNESVEAMIDKLKAQITKMGYNAATMSGYYILDGKVCLPKDYDPKTQNFKDGAVPPPWAGGPSINTLLEKVGQEEFKVERPTYTPQENMEAIRPILEKNAAKKTTTKPAQEEADFEWEAEDVDDDELLEEAASKSRKRAITKLTKTPAKRVVKKPAAASRRRTTIVKKTAAKKQPAKKTITRRKK